MYRAAKKSSSPSAPSPPRNVHTSLKTNYTLYVFLYRLEVFIFNVFFTESDEGHGGLLCSSYETVRGSEDGTHHSWRVGLY